MSWKMKANWQDACRKMDEARRLVKDGHENAGVRSMRAALKDKQNIILDSQFGLAQDHIAFARLHRLDWQPVSADEALQSLSTALELYLTLGHVERVADTRELLARMLEYVETSVSCQGSEVDGCDRLSRLEQARELRESGVSDGGGVACAGPRSCHKVMLGDEAKRCAGCDSIYYCSPTCQLADWPRHYQLCRVYTLPEAPPPSSLELTPASTIIHSDTRFPSFLSFAPSTAESPVPPAPLTHDHQHNDVEQACSPSPTVPFSDHDRHCHRHRYRYPRPRRVSSPVLPSYGARSHATNGWGAPDSRSGASFARRQHSDGDLPDYVDEGWRGERRCLSLRSFIPPPIDRGPDNDWTPHKRISSSASTSSTNNSINIFGRARSSSATTAPRVTSPPPVEQQKRNSKIVVDLDRGIKDDKLHSPSGHRSASPPSPSRRKFFVNPTRRRSVRSSDGDHVDLSVREELPVDKKPRRWSRTPTLPPAPVASLQQQQQELEPIDSTSSLSLSSTVEGVGGPAVPLLRKPPTSMPASTAAPLSETVAGLLKLLSTTTQSEATSSSMSDGSS